MIRSSMCESSSGNIIASDTWSYVDLCFTKAGAKVV